MMKYLFLLVLPILFSATCKNADTCLDAETLTLKDFSGLDACEWLLEKTDGTRLEPTNLDDFITDFKDGTVIQASFKIEEGFASACQAGTIVSIICVND